MTARPVVPRARAVADVDDAIDHYLAEAGPEVALRFIDALEQAYAGIAGTPAAGSPRWAHELNLPGLRSLRIKGFPHILFYMERETSIDVWRLLHARRDVPLLLAEEEDGQ